MGEVEKDKTAAQTRMEPQTADPEGLYSRLLLPNLSVLPSWMNKLWQQRTMLGC